MKSAIRFAMLALVLVIVAMVSALTAMRFAIHGQEVAVPLMIGLAPAEAEHAVAGLGLQISIERQYYSPQIPEGRIMSQLPLPGTKVRRGWQVRVAQSLGKMRVTIPDVTGQSEHAAELNIRRRGLDVDSTAVVQEPGIPADQVLAQSPTAKETQVAAPKISFLVSAAPDPPAFVMPSFIGQPLGSVSRSLQDAGFKLGNVNVVVPASADVADAATTSEHYCVAGAGGGAESACWGGSEFRRAVRTTRHGLARISADIPKIFPKPFQGLRRRSRRRGGRLGGCVSKGRA
jgi:beta-lactam-binding protein with PASTA domain